MDGYQPPLLSLQDMLNLSDNEEDNWSTNPYNLSNFFEPIARQTKSGDATSSVNTSSLTTSQTPSGYSYSEKSGAATVPYMNPFDDIQILSTLGNITSSSFVSSDSDLAQQKSAANIKREATVNDNAGGENGFGDCNDKFDDSKEELPNLDFFDESMVVAELEEAEVNSEIDPTEMQDPLANIVAEKLYQMSPQKCMKQLDNTQTSTPIKTISSSGQWKNAVINQPKKGPTLKEVKLDDIRREDIKAKFKLDMEKKTRDEAINQLTSLINTLKRYRNQLKDFLTHEGDMILEHYNAKNLLRGILPEIIESTSVTGQQNIFDEAHTITKVLTSHVRNRTPTLHLRKAHFWRGSDLLLLQKTILETVIHNREFLLKCRYTDLLMQMGFDAEDLQRLEKSLTKQAELGELKIIINEHEFFNKLKSSKKQVIQTTIVTQDYKGSGIPRVYVFPSPAQLVEDKWKALIEIRRRTVLSAIEDKDINWLHVLKVLADKNPKLHAVDESTCKLTYEHLLSFRYNNNPWHIAELEKLRDIRSTNPHCAWSWAATVLGTNRSPFSCFVKFKTHCLKVGEQGHHPQLPPNTLRLVESCFEDCLGNAFQVNYMLSRVLKKHHSWMAPNKLIFLAQKTLSPRLRKGIFSVVEDAILLVAMEKYKKYILETVGAIDPIAYALPWRYISSWKMRLKTFVTNFYSKTWTLEEDQRLWHLVEIYGSNYSYIQRWFPFKDRKQCRSRHVHLLKVFQTTALEDYHKVYYSGRRSLNMKRMLQVAEHLRMTINSKLLGNAKYVRPADLEFLKLRRTPTDNQLECYLMTFSTRLMAAAFKRIVGFMTHIVNTWRECPKQDSDEGTTSIAKYLLGYDRRSLDPLCPVSVGSALHLRNAKLVPQDTVENMTEFEAKVYSAFNYFAIRSSVKRNTKRKGIPSLDILRKLHSVSRIVVQPPWSGKPGQPSVVVTIKSDEVERERQDKAFLQELVDQRKGGARKGTKRKRTQIKEAKKRAAMIRWEKQRLDTDTGVENKAETENKEIGDGKTDVAGSPAWDAFSPGTPLAPASVASTTTDTDSVIGIEPSMRKAVMGMISDHAYILPMASPAELSNLSLPQLFAKMGRGKGKQAGSGLGYK